MAGGFPLMPSVFEHVSGYPLLGFTRDPKPEKLAKVLKNYGEPAGTRTQGPRLKRATQAITTEDDRVRPIDTIPLKSCKVSFVQL